MSFESAVIDYATVCEIVAEACQGDGAAHEVVDRGTHETHRVMGVDEQGRYVLTFIRKCAPSRQKSNWQYTELRGRHAAPYWNAAR